MKPLDFEELALVVEFLLYGPQFAHDLDPFVGIRVALSWSIVGRPNMSNSGETSRTRRSAQSGRSSGDRPWCTAWRPRSDGSAACEERGWSSARPCRQPRSGSREDPSKLVAPPKPFQRATGTNASEARSVRRDDVAAVRPSHFEMPRRRRRGAAVADIGPEHAELQPVVAEQRVQERRSALIAERFSPASMRVATYRGRVTSSWTWGVHRGDKGSGWRQPRS